MEIIIKNNYSEISSESAIIIANQIKAKPDSVLGLATGSTPIGLYEELVRLHLNEGLDFSNVISFNLDEYVGLPKEHEQSYKMFMQNKLFSKINIKEENIHIPDGSLPICDKCEKYESSIKSFGGIDLQILGIGSDGHIAFNEPSSSLGSRTRVKTLTEETIKDNSIFFNDIANVPKFAITMGVGTIMEAKEILLLASGKSKAIPIKKAIEGPITSMCSASAIQMHPKTIVILDKDAAKDLNEQDYYKWVHRNKVKFN